MKLVFKIFLAGILLLQIASCMPKKPYEIKSPCVAGESDSGIHPCVRKPVNIRHDIA